MPISSLLLLVEADRADAIRAHLEADPRTTPGELIGNRLPVALETPDRQADKEAWAWLRATPGVSWIDLVWISIDLDDATAFGRAHEPP